MPSKLSTKEHRLLDTNFFIRYFLDDVPEQTEIVKNILRRGEDGSVILIVNLNTIIEINTVLKYTYEIDKINRLLVLNEIKDISFLKYPTKDIESHTKKSIELYNQYNLDFEDCTALALSLANDYTLFSFDVKLKKVAKELGIKRIP